MREEDHVLLAMLNDAANYGKNSLRVRKEGRVGKLTWLQCRHNLTSTLSWVAQAHVYRISDRRTHGLDSAWDV